MRSRCHNPTAKDYRNYGAKGITVCEQWRTDFPRFLADVGSRPSRQHSLDRINNSGNYEPGNCRWALPIVQHNNTSTNRYLTAQGRTQTIAEWSRELGISSVMLYSRVAMGWNADRVVTQPARVTRRPATPPSR
jgi:hypothetical protein